MTDELTPAQIRALADEITGRRGDNTDDVIEAVAADAPDQDEPRSLPPADDEEEA